MRPLFLPLDSCVKQENKEARDAPAWTASATISLFHSPRKISAAEESAAEEWDRLN